MKIWISDVLGPGVQKFFQNRFTENIALCLQQIVLIVLVIVYVRGDMPFRLNYEKISKAFNN